jgi:hypothetical protein
MRRIQGKWEVFRERPRSPYLQSLFPFKRCGESGGNGYKVHTEVYDGYGDMELADRRFTIDRKSRVLTMTDFQAEDREQSVTLEGGQMAKLLRYIVHTLEIFMWEQDICSYEDYLPDRPEELYLSLLEYFESEDEVF